MFIVKSILFPIMFSEIVASINSNCSDKAISLISSKISSTSNREYCSPLTFVNFFFNLIKRIWIVIFR